MKQLHISNQAWFWLGNNVSSWMWAVEEKHCHGSDKQIRSSHKITSNTTHSGQDRGPAPMHRPYTNQGLKPNWTKPNLNHTILQNLNLQTTFQINIWITNLQQKLIMKQFKLVLDSVMNLLNFTFWM